MRTKFGDGYVLGKSEYQKDWSEQKQFYYIKIGKNTHEIERDEILPDCDSNDIYNNMADMNKLLD